MIDTSPKIKELKELHDGIKVINDDLAVKSTNDGHSLADDLSTSIQLLSYNSRLMQLATELYGWAKGKVHKKMMEDEKLLGAKDSIQRLYIAGELAFFDAKYEETKNAVDNLEKKIEGLRSLLGFEKENMKKSI